MEFQENKPKALWKFLREHLHSQWQKKNWSWEYFAARRDRRTTWIKAEIRLFHYSRPLTQEEMAARRDALKRMTCHEASFGRSYFNYQVRIIPAHKYVHQFLQ